MCFFILIRAIGYYTKLILKLVSIVLIGAIFVILLIGAKFNPIYKVSINGLELGYVKDTKEIDSKLFEIIKTEDNSVAFIVDENIPKYELVYNSYGVKCNDEEILETISNTPLVAYKTYAIVLDDEEKEVVNSFEEANKIVEDLKEKIGEEYQLTLGIREVYTLNSEIRTLPELTLAKAELEDDVNKKIEILGSSVNGVYLTKPLNGTITSRYGVMSSIRSGAHTGLDIANATGTEICAAASGKVKKAGFSGSYGNLVVLEHENGVETYYAHCSRLLVNVGDEVEQGQAIAKVGSTGNSTGPHLHFEVRVDGETLNPQKFLYK